MASESIDRVLTVLVARLADMTEAQNGWPASAGWDATARGVAHWCWEHERDVDACHKAGDPCDGEAVASPGDRTGEAALRKDRAAAHRREVERLILNVERDARRLEQLVSLYGNRPPTSDERQATLTANQRDESCWSCARIASSPGVSRWEPAARTAEVAGERRQLCWWCFDWIRKGDGSPPSVSVLEQHHRGQRVRRPA